MIPELLLGRIAARNKGLFSENVFYDSNFSRTLGL